MIFFYFSLSGLCDFENKDLCNWANVPGMNFDWRLEYGTTLTFGTGPGFDHTTLTNKGLFCIIFYFQLTRMLK